MRDYLKHFIRNWKAKVVSLFIGIAVFAYVQELKMETMNISVPVVYEARPSNMLWVDEPPRFIKITIRGRKEDLKFPTANLTARVDLSGARNGSRRYSIVFDRAQIPEKIKILSIPQYFVIKFEENSIKNVFIKAVFEGKLEQGYNRGRAIINPQKIEIRGPTSVLERIKTVETEPINLKEVTQDIEKEVLLVSPHRGVSLSRKRVEIEVPVYQEDTTNEVIVENVAIQVLNLDPALEVFLSDQTIKVHIRGDQSVLNNITADAFVATINLEGTKYNPKTRNILPFDTESGIPIEIKTNLTGQGVDILDITPDNLTVRFKIKAEFIVPDEAPKVPEQPGGGGEGKPE